MAIDVGDTDVTANLAAAEYTWIETTNVANATGLIFTVEVQSGITALSDIEVASFYESGGVWYTRDYVSLPNQASAGITTYTVSNGDFRPFEIRSGDAIGIYYGAGDLYFKIGSTGDGEYKSGDYIPSSGESFTTADRKFYLYATGLQLGQINIGDAWKDIQNIQINIGDSWKQLCDMEINISDVWKKGVY